MKKIFTTFLSTIVLGSIMYAQSTTEILQLSQNTALGTARFNGLSGAFGALGGDLTALTINPAGSAVFQNSYGSVTLEQNGTSSESNYFGDTSRNNNANLNFNQIGGVLILKNTSGNGPSKISLGLSYNKTNNFRNRINFSGNANNSISDFFVGEANGIDSNTLLLQPGESLQDAYIAIGENPLLGFSGQQGLLGFQGELIDNTENGNDPTVFQSNVRNDDNITSTEQIVDIETRGNSGKVTFNFGAEFKKRFYLGANLNIHNLNYNRSVIYDESVNGSLIGSQGITRAIFINETETNGNGFSLDLGAIAKLSDQVRLGLSYQTPTFYELQDSYSQQLETFFNDGSSQFVDPNIIIVLPEYQFRTPGTLSGSIAFIAGKRGLLSAQYSRKDFSNTKFTSDGDAFDELNNTIEATFKATNTFRVGGEYRYENWRLRGGLSKITSPYKDSRIAGDTDGFSLGAGYNWGKWKFDAAFNRTVTERRETLFETNNFDNSANINTRNSAVTMTLGVNF